MIGKQGFAQIVGWRSLLIAGLVGENLIFGLFVAFGNQPWLKFDHHLQASLYLYNRFQSNRGGGRPPGRSNSMFRGPMVILIIRWGRQGHQMDLKTNVIILAFLCQSFSCVGFLKLSIAVKESNILSHHSSLCVFWLGNNGAVQINFETLNQP